MLLCNLLVLCFFGSTVIINVIVMGNSNSSLGSNSNRLCLNI